MWSPFSLDIKQIVEPEFSKGCTIFQLGDGKLYFNKGDTQKYMDILLVITICFHNKSSVLYWEEAVQEAHILI